MTKIPKWEGKKEVIETMRDMKLNQGKSLKEIKEYCLTQGVKTYDAEIIKLCKPVDAHQPKKEKRAYTRRAKGKRQGGGRAKDP